MIARFPYEHIVIDDRVLVVVNQYVKNTLNVFPCQVAGEWATFNLTNCTMIVLGRPLTELQPLADHVDEIRKLVMPLKR